MTRRLRWLVYLAAASTSLLMLSFIVFATMATRAPTLPPAKAEAIVVLTGGTEQRINTAMRLLRTGAGERLLITGVNRKTKAQDLLAHFGASRLCCIDLGYEALDTIGNAIETRDWAARHGYSSLVVVTSSYHMPRSINELAMVMPAAELIAHPVRPKAFGEGAWWLNAQAVRILLAEYLKLITSYTRYAAHRVISPLDAIAAPGRSSAATPANH